MTESTENHASSPLPLRLPLSEEALKAWMREYILKMLSLDETTFDSAARFDAYGLDSVEAVVMAGVMEEEFGVPIEPALLFDHPSIDSFAAAHCARD